MADDPLPTPTPGRKIAPDLIQRQSARAVRRSASVVPLNRVVGFSLVKLFHSYRATKPFSGTDEAISSSQEDIPKQALDTVAASNNQTREGRAP